MKEQFIYNKIKNLIILIDKNKKDIIKNREIGEDNKILILEKIDKVSKLLKDYKIENNSMNTLLKTEINGIINTVGELGKSLEIIDTLADKNSLLSVQKEVETISSELVKINEYIDKEINKLDTKLSKAIDQTNKDITKTNKELKKIDVEKSIKNAIKDFTTKNELKELETSLKDSVKITEIRTEEPVIEIGEVEMVSPGVPPEVNIINDNGKYILNFKIPQGVRGKRGLRGEPGSNKIFIQETQPITSETTYMWWETNPDQTLKTLWVETGGAE